MFSGFTSIALPALSASTNRLIVLMASSLLLLAAGDVSQAVSPYSGAEISDSILAPLSAADAAASAAAITATTPADVAAAFAASNIATDEPARPASLSSLVASVDDSDVAGDTDLKCLATAVYFESRGEPMEGQLAVAQTIMNRVESGRYASTVCGVINQPKQFSYDRSRTPRAGNDWEVAQAIAKIAADELWRDVVPQAISFHAKRVAPNWAGKTRVATIGNHIFYR